MKFQYYNPIHFQFGTDVFEQITTLLNNDNIPYIEYGNQTITTYKGILDGIVLKVDAIIEIGGASAMDTGKAIAFGMVHENLENYIEGRKISDNRHLFNIIIPTYPSTGSEANGVCDIMEYKGAGTELFSIYKI